MKARAAKSTQADSRCDCWAASLCDVQSFHITEAVTHKQDSFVPNQDFIIRNIAKHSKFKRYQY